MLISILQMKHKYWIDCDKELTRFIQLKKLTKFYQKCFQIESILLIISGLATYRSIWPFDKVKRKYRTKSKSKRNKTSNSRQSAFWNKCIFQLANLVVPGEPAGIGKSEIPRIDFTVFLFAAQKHRYFEHTHLSILGDGWVTFKHTA